MDFNIEVEDGKSVRLPTAEKYCDYDIVVTAKGGSNDLAKQLIERSVTKISDESVEFIGAYAFAGCEELTEVSFPNCTEVEASVFLNASGLISIDFPKLLRAAGNFCSACVALKNVNFPIAVQLMSNSFQNCSSLEKIDLPNVTTINNQVFVNCGMLNTVILRSKATLSNTNSFTGTPIANGAGHIYVPAALIESYYKTATNWSVFANQFRAIEDYPDICGEVSS